MIYPINSRNYVWNSLPQGLQNEQMLKKVAIAASVAFVSLTAGAFAIGVVFTATVIAGQITLALIVFTALFAQRPLVPSEDNPPAQPVVENPPPPRPEQKSLIECVGEINSGIERFREAFLGNQQAEIARTYTECIMTLKAVLEKYPNYADEILKKMQGELVVEAFKQAFLAQTLPSSQEFAEDYLVNGRRSNNLKVLDLTTQRYDVRKTAEAKHVRLYADQLDNYVTDLMEFHKVNPRLPVISLTLVLGPHHQTLTAKQTQSLEKLSELIAVPPRVQVVGLQELYSLTIDASVVPIVPPLMSVRELTITGPIDQATLVQALKRFPDLAFLSLENGEIDFESIKAQFPRLQWVRHANRGIQLFKPRYENSDSFKVDPEIVQKMLENTKNYPFDFTIRSGEQSINVHRSILANHSYVLRQIRDQKELNLDGIQGLQKVFEYSYTGTVEIANVEEALQIVDVAEDLKMPGLLRHALDYVEQNLNEATFSLYAVKGLYAKRALRLFAEQHPSLPGASDILKERFPIPRSIASIDPLLPFGDPVSKGLSDYRIPLGEREYHVHKAILASRSMWFKNTFEKDGLLSTYFTEGDENTIHPDQMQRVLEYVYSGLVPQFISEEEQLGFLWVADHFQLAEIVHKIIQNIKQSFLPSDEQINVIFRMNQRDIQMMNAKLDFYLIQCEHNTIRDLYEDGIKVAIKVVDALIAAKKRVELIRQVREMINHAPREFQGVRESIVKIDDYLATLVPVQ